MNELATELVGDGKNPNLFFVGRGANVELVTTNFHAAYNLWLDLPRDVETMLEDRMWGTICDTAPVDDGSTELRTGDDSAQFLKRYPRFNKNL